MRWNAIGSLSAALAVGLLGMSQAARAQTACDPNNFDRQCAGTELTFCSTQTNQTATFDCAGFFPDATANTTCGPRFDCIDGDNGATCATVTDDYCIGAAQGSQCSFQLAAQGDPQLFCAAGLGCVLGADAQGQVEETCETTGQCNLAEENLGCVGDVATFCASGTGFTVRDAAGVDCGDLNGSCVEDPTDGPVCAGNEGALCDDLTLFPGSPFRCAADLECVGADAQQFGTCQVSAPVVDAGPAPDAGPGGDAGPELCNGVTYEGSCDGTDAIFCSDPSSDPSAELVRYTCGAFQVGDETLAGTCDVLNAWGSWCVFPTGTDCAFVGTNNNLIVFGCGDANGVVANSACAFGTGCTEGVGACTPPADPNAFQATCVGDFLATGCTAWGQYYGVDCATLPGGGCDANGAVCRAGVGAECLPGGTVECVEGLVCQGADEVNGTPGVCVDPNNPGTPTDGGPAPADDAGPAPTDDAGTPPTDGGTPPVGDAGDPPVGDAGNNPPPPPEDAGNNPPPEDAGNNPPPPPEDAGNNPPPPPEDAGNGGNGGNGGSGGNGGGVDAGLGDDKPEDPPGGCACDTSSSDGAGFGLFALALLALRRRRR